MSDRDGRAEDAMWERWEGRRRGVRSRCGYCREVECDGECEEALEAARQEADEMAVELEHPHPGAAR